MRTPPWRRRRGRCPRDRAARPPDAGCARAAARCPSWWTADAAGHRHRAVRHADRPAAACRGRRNPAGSPPSGIRRGPERSARHGRHPSRRRRRGRRPAGPDRAAPGRDRRRGREARPAEPNRPRPDRAERRADPAARGSTGTTGATTEAGTAAAARATGTAARTAAQTRGTAGTRGNGALAVARTAGGAGSLLAAVGDVDGQHDQCGRAAGVGRAELDTDAVSQGQAADHEQTHAAGDRDVHGGRRRQPLVDRGEVLGERPMPVSWISTRTRPSGSA